MKNIIVLSFLTLIFLSSCKDAMFDRYPGTKLDSIPQELRGEFKDPDTKSKTKNTIIVAKNYWMESSKDTKYFLSDSMVLSSYNGAYFLSTLDDNKQYWHILYVKPSGKDLELFALFYDSKVPAEKNSITKYFTPKFDADSNAVFTMNEEKLLLYTQKELLNEESMKLKRIKLKR
jgi:hypothetical protein